MTDVYFTVAGQGESAFEVQGSTFIGHVTPAKTVAEAETFVETIREEHADATHNVPAYRVRDGEFLREYESDANEPSGSAGKPALNVLQGKELENVAAVVTRYYGGTKLGIGGLVSAYSQAVKEAVDDAGVLEERPHERFVVNVEYDDSGTVRGILESVEAEFEAHYDEQVTFEVRVPKPGATALKDRLRSVTSGRADIEKDS